MTDDLSDEEQMGRGGGGIDMNGDDENLDMEVDPKRGGRRQKQRSKQRVPHDDDDDENF